MRCGYSRLGHPDTYVAKKVSERAFGHRWCHAVSTPIFCQPLVLRCRTEMIPLAGGEQVTLSFNRAQMHPLKGHRLSHLLSYGRKWLDVLLDK